MEGIGFAALGGVLIGLASAGLMLFNGRIAGVSGIFQGLLSPRLGDLAWRAAFVGGLVLAGVGVGLVMPEAFASTLDRSFPVLALAGLLVGFGARLGSGCTSGHGVCGLGRLSPRSGVSVGTFTAAGMLAVFVYALLTGGM